MSVDLFGYVLSSHEAYYSAMFIILMGVGDAQPVGEGVSELRIDYGPGYRVYFKKIGSAVLILLAGGDKRTQDADIKTALRLARNL
jgi:putative addiction module killer protein